MKSSDSNRWSGFGTKGSVSGIYLFVFSGIIGDSSGELFALEVGLINPSSFLNRGFATPNA